MLVLPDKNFNSNRPSPTRTAEILRRRFGAIVEARAFGDSIVLEGRARDYGLKVELGWAAAKFGYKGVVNDVACDGIAEESLPPSAAQDSSLDGLSVDVLVVGGGVTGSAIARELSKRDLSILLVDKEEDLAVHTSSRNDGMIHDGFAAHPGSLKAKYNVRGNRLWEPLCAELGLAFRRPGSLILFRSPASRLALPLMAARAKKLGVDGWEYWSKARVEAEEPFAAPGHFGGFFLPSAGVLSPYRATVALAENAVLNGARVSVETCVTGFELEGGRIIGVRTNRGSIRAGAVVNAAGNWSDVVAAMAGDRFFSLHQRRGTDAILDLSTGELQRHIMSKPSLLQVKSKTKGGGLVPTVEGNILVGPTASESPGREDYATRPEELAELRKHLLLNTGLAFDQAITYFSGVRPCTYEEDFVVERSGRVENLIHAAGIQSPGLASAPAIAEDVARMVIEVVSAYRAVAPRKGWNPRRPAPPELRSMPAEARNGAIEARPAYGRIVCRCEEVSEGEIIDAMRSTIPARSLDGIKRRTRAGAGRCHGGFCSPRVVEIAASELGVEPCKVTKKGPGSELCPRSTKGGRR